MTDRSYLTSSDLAMDRDSIKRSFASHIEYTLAKDEYSVTQRDFNQAIARWANRIVHGSGVMEPHAAKKGFLSFLR